MSKKTETTPETTTPADQAPETLTNARGVGPFFELRQINGKWHWVLWAQNGRALAINAEPYNQQNDAARAIERLKTFIGKNPPVLVTRD